MVTAITQTETEVDRQTRLLGEVDRELVEIAGKLQTEEVSRKHAHEAIDRAKRQLPPHWQKPAETAGLTDRTRWSKSNFLTEKPLRHRCGVRLRCEIRSGI